MNRQDYISGDWVLSTSADYQNRIVQIEDINRNGTIHAIDDGNEVILNQGEYEPIPMSEEWLWQWDYERTYHDANCHRYFAPRTDYLHPSDVPFHVSYYVRDKTFYIYTMNQFIMVISYVHELQHLLYAAKSKIEIKKPKKI